MVQIAPYSIVAVNVAKHSENKMHDDTVAKQYGFSGGLVPGVDVFAYMSHAPLERWGGEFLERGVMEGRFLKPLYDGKTAVVSAAEQNGALEIKIESEGALCGTGRATLSDRSPALSIDDFKAETPPFDRPSVDTSSYAVGKWLGIRPHAVLPDLAAQYLAAIHETNPLYVKDRIIPPGTLLRCVNWALTHNAVLGPWIHVGSKIEFLQPAHVGDTLSVRARVTGNYDRKGHKFVELDALIISNEKTAVARVAHTAIYEPRRLAVA